MFFGRNSVTVRTQTHVCLLSQSMGKEGHGQYKKRLETFNGRIVHINRFPCLQSVVEAEA